MRLFNSLLLLLVSASASIAGTTNDVGSYGAIPGVTNMQTSAIQAAINACPAYGGVIIDGKKETVQ